MSPIIFNNDPTQPMPLFCTTCGELTWRTFAGSRIDGEPVAMVWHTCRHGHLTEDPTGASRIFAAFGADV